MEMCHPQGSNQGSLAGNSLNQSYVGLNQLGNLSNWPYGTPQICPTCHTCPTCGRKS